VSLVLVRSTTKLTTRQLGPALAFERLWRETGCERVIRELGRRARISVRSRAARAVRWIFYSERPLAARNPLSLFDTELKFGVSVVPQNGSF
jgi:hypothetical protein